MSCQKMKIVIKNIQRNQNNFGGIADSTSAR